MNLLQLNFLHVAIFVSLVFLGAVISPFLTTLVLAAILVTGTYPIYKWILKKVGNRTRLAATIMALIIGIMFSVAFFFFFLLLSQEAVSTYQDLEQWLRSGKINLNTLIGKISKYVGMPPVDVISSVSQWGQAFSGTIVAQSTNLIKSIVWLVINFFLLVFSMYFFFKDGEFLIQAAEKILPLPNPYGREIFQKFRRVSLGMLYGIFFTAIAQGLLGGIGLGVAGVRNPVFWGTIMGFLGMLPIGGTAAVWLPASIILFLGGHYVSAIGLLIWCALVVASLDNLIKPFVIAKHAKIYPLATFLVVVGGLMVFGLKGAIISPMVLAALVSLLHIHQSQTDKQPVSS